MNQQDRYGPLPQDRDAWTRKCRLLQSWYRVEVLGIEVCGPWRVGGDLVGSTLIDGETTGANFISEQAFAYAQQRVIDKVSNPAMTLDAYRLFNNMLSSMPMCFNLFSDLRHGVQQGDADATPVIRAMFDTSPIKQVDEVVVEMIPTPVDHYINDKSAWDAAVLYRDAEDRPGLASVETKYTDKLGKNTASRRDFQIEVAQRLGVFTPSGLDGYRANGFDQAARNLLLTLAYAERHGLKHAKNYVLAPEGDKEGPRAVEAIRARLKPEHRGDIEFVSLENVVERGLEHAGETLAKTLQAFHRRYLDFSRIAHLG